MTNFLQNYLELRRHEEWLTVKTPGFDEEIKDEIKALPAVQRAWEKPLWKIQEIDPDQALGAETNLQFARRVCQECCDRRGWTLLDYTADSPAGIAQQKADAVENWQESHVKAVLTVLPKLPASALKLVAWGDQDLEVQLMAFLDDSALFSELKNASLEMWKPAMLCPSVDPKRSFNFTFRFATDPRIIRALMTVPYVDYLETLMREAQRAWGALAEEEQLRNEPKTHWEFVSLHVIGEDLIWDALIGVNLDQGDTVHDAIARYSRFTGETTIQVTSTYNKIANMNGLTDAESAATFFDTDFRMDSQYLDAYQIAADCGLEVIIP